MKTEIIQSIFSNNNGVKLEIHDKRKILEIHKHVGINTLLNNQWVKKKSQGKL